MFGCLIPFLCNTIEHLEGKDLTLTTVAASVLARGVYSQLEGDCEVLFIKCDLITASRRKSLFGEGQSYPLVFCLSFNNGGPTHKFLMAYFSKI